MIKITYLGNTHGLKEFDKKKKTQRHMYVCIQPKTCFNGAAILELIFPNMITLPVVQITVVNVMNIA